MRADVGETIGPTVLQRVLGLLGSPVPGVTHLLVLESYFVGTLLAVGFIAGVSLVTAGRVVWTGEEAVLLRGIGWALIAATEAVSISAAIRWLVVVDHAARARTRDDHFRSGLAAYVRGENHDAVDAFRRALGLAPHEAAIRFHLGMALMRLGRPRRARRMLIRSVRWDPDRRWIDEAHRALAELDSPVERRPSRRRGRARARRRL